MGSDKQLEEVVKSASEYLGANIGIPITEGKRSLDDLGEQLKKSTQATTLTIDALALAIKNAADESAKLGRDMVRLTRALVWATVFIAIATVVVAFFPFVWEWLHRCPVANAG